MKHTKQFLTILLLNFVLIATQSTWAKDVLRISTTTSTENSGLLAVLNPVFQEKHNARIDVIAVGTGKALRIGGNGDVDVVFVHAPVAEMKYVEQGDFINRSAVMHNDFVIVGPKHDPANIASATTVVGALAKIATAQAPFISRGDDSGTHKKEKQLWEQVGVDPKGDWYASAGQGMGAVLRIVDDKQGYALTDRGTQIAYSDKMSLQVLFEGGSALFNPYHIMAVNPEKHQHVNYKLAKKYIDFVVGEQGQKIIADYKKSGQQLFYPDVAN
jgi:tungstate transport system substrate-binding protein